MIPKSFCIYVSYYNEDMFSFARTNWTCSLLLRHNQDVFFWSNKNRESLMILLNIFKNRYFFGDLGKNCRQNIFKTYLFHYNKPVISWNILGKLYKSVFSVQSIANLSNFFMKSILHYNEHIILNISYKKRSRAQ